MCLFVFAQGVGYIQIQCEPGAMVFLDNDLAGKTSSELEGLILQDVPAGSYQIKIVKEGFEPQSVKINLKANEIYVYKVKEFIPQLDVTQKGEADTDSIRQRVGSLLIETIPIDCIIEIPKLSINKEHYGNKTKKTWEISNIPIGSYSVNFIALGKKIEYNLQIEEGVQEHLLVNVLKGEVKDIAPYPVTFGFRDGTGKIEARADGNLINSGDLVKEGSKVVFKVTPDYDQTVRSLEVNGKKIDTLADQAYIFENLKSAIDFKVNLDVNPYKFGIKGPAGGWIFYDKGSYSDGWRYLEASPESTEWRCAWGSVGTLIGGTERGIGTGKSNTAKIVEWLNSHGETGKAAQLCDALVYGGYSDWFLPSIEELDLIYKNLKVYSVGGFKNDCYWSSWEMKPKLAANMGFTNHDAYGQYKRYSSIRARAIRAF